MQSLHMLNRPTSNWSTASCCTVVAWVRCQHAHGNMCGPSCRYEDGQKTRYFADDDKADLDTLVKRTK
jgi:hypothetical protein